MIAIRHCFTHFSISFDCNTATVVAFLVSVSFFTCSDILCLVVPFSVLVEGLLLTALHVGRVDMMDGGVEGWMERRRYVFFVDIVPRLPFTHSALDGYPCSNSCALTIR